MRKKIACLAAGCLAFAAGYFAIGLSVAENTTPSPDRANVEVEQVPVAHAAGNTDPRVEKAVLWALEIANDPVHGYSQGAENATYYNPYTGSREGPDYDCSALVYHAFTHGGFDIIDVWQKQNPKYYSRYNGKQYSGDADTIWEDLQKLGGFTKYSWNEIKNDLKRGDIICWPQHHVAIYVGDGWTVEARGVNNPTGMGRYETGDQGGEIDCYEAYGRNWTEVYRYTGN